MGRFQFRGSQTYKRKTGEKKNVTLRKKILIIPSSAEKESRRTYRRNDGGNVERLRWWGPKKNGRKPQRRKGEWFKLHGKKVVKKHNDVKR